MPNHTAIWENRPPNNIRESESELIVAPIGLPLSRHDLDNREISTARYPPLQRFSG